jgi:hypothetical protein
MAGDYRCEPLADLAKQLRYAPPPRRLRQVDQAELLYWQIDPDQNYPPAFVTFRITGYRTDETVEPATLVGSAVRDDLIRLVDELACTLALPIESFDQPALTIEQLAEQLNVSTRTIKRYRKQGLFARYATHTTSRGPRKQVVFLPDSVDRFRTGRGEKLADAAAFERLPEADRQEIITRARRITSRVSVSPFRVSRHLAPRYGCHPETIRRMLINHDAHDPRFAIFRDYRAPLGDHDQRLIARAYHRGIPVRKIRERFACRADAIYRTVLLRRCENLRAIDLGYIASPTFELPDAEQVILGTDLPRIMPTEAPVRGERPVIEAPIDATIEASLFARYNYLKCRAAAARDAMDPKQPTSAELDEAETLVRRAQRVRWRIERAFEPIVEAVVRRHHGSGRDVVDRTLGTLRRIGRRVFHRAINQFDVAKNNRFHTYLTYTLMRRFAEKPRRVTRRRARVVLPRRFEPPQPQTVEALRALLGSIDPRAAALLSGHYGAINALGETTDPKPLHDLARQHDMSVTTAQRLTRIAYRTLRRSAAEQSLNLRQLLPLRDVPGVQ